LATAKSKSKSVATSAKSTARKAVPKNAKGTPKSTKVAVKRVTKATAKVPKPAPKTGRKAAPKPAPKATQKTAKKAAAKPAPKAKAGVKTAAKESAKPVVKPSSNQVAKAAATKPVIAEKAKAAAGKPVEPPKAPATGPKPASSHGVAPVLAASPIGTPLNSTARPAAKNAPSVSAAPFKFTPSTVKEGGVMSEAELLKQPKSEYMSKQQLAFFRFRLLTLQSQLRENAGATTEHLREISVAPDPADRATLEEEHALELRTRDRERKLLKKVESALERIADGTYGYCEETGEPIGIPRLLARPTATLTIEAQERREMKQKMYGE
jgi:DnaK suppressor protein